jgi:hypothetical protein
MVTQLDIARDPNSIATYIIPFSADCWTLRLAADTELTVAVPAGSAKAIISGDDYYFVSTSTITLPTEGAAALKTGAHQAFDAVDVTGVTTLYFKARNPTDLSVSFYS